MDDIDRLVLRVKYDDGFVAWINGQRVASRNAPLEPLWNSSAVSAQPQRIVFNEESIDLSDFKHTLLQGSNVLAIQGLNIASDNPRLPGLRPPGGHPTRRRRHGGPLLRCPDPG